MDGYVQFQLELIRQRQARVREEAAAERLGAAVRRHRERQVGEPFLVAWARSALEARWLAPGQ